jgi:CubicO group peptidase (beta-lactamase class C family)
LYKQQISPRMNKSIMALAIFTIFSFVACQNKSGTTPLLTAHLPLTYEIKDSSVVTIPFGVEFQKLDESYKLEKQRAVKNFYQKHIANQDFSGSFLVAKNGNIIYENYQGYSDFASKSPIKNSTPLHIASVSKVLTATAILKLVQNNDITLDQKVTSILPQFPYQSTTIRTLLNHRSGLPNYARFEVLLKNWNRKTILTNQEVLNLLAKHKFALSFKHDSHFSYCNTNYAILALIIEKITDKTYVEAMKSLIFEPLEMNDSFVMDYPSEKHNVSQSYKSSYQNFGWDQYDAIYGDKNIYATPRDLLKFDLATYSNDFIDQNLLKQALKGYSYEKKGLRNYGLGIRLREWETGQVLTYHNGWWHGNTSSYVTLKKDTVTIIALSNKYTKKTYQAMKLSALFGDYPFELEADLSE